jgi:hypothetical protein
MAQLFRPGANTIVRIALVSLVAGPAAVLGGAMALQRTSYVTGQHRFVDQPVPFSHQHHVGDLGLDCRFCHGGVESAAYAGTPPTKTCMTCHSQIWTNAEMLAPVRESFAKGVPIAWNRVNDLPGYVYFDHHVHVNNGVPCAACHGDVSKMPLTVKAAPMTMQFCLGCHREPAQRLVPQQKVFDPEVRAEIGEEAAKVIHARVAALPKTQSLTDCSVCHR